MHTQSFSFSYEVYAGLDELNEADRLLALAAIEAMTGSYAPYSKFNVGAAVRMSGGAIVRGSNQENMAYPSGMCAERTAMFAAGAQYPDERMEAIAIVASSGGVMTEIPVAACGQCRQTMSEYTRKGGKPIEVLMIGSKRIYKLADSNMMLPFIGNFEI